MPYQASEIQRWLANRVYLGEVRYGELVNESAHEPLTDPATFERCQRERGERRTAPSRFLLAGFIRCAWCRYAMAGFNHGGSSTRTPVYRCPGRGCEQRSVITAERIEAHVIGELRSRLTALTLNAGDAEEIGEEALAEAEAELRAFATDLGARQALGEAGWQEALAARVADRDAKRAALRRRLEEKRLSRLARDIDDLDRHDLRDLLAGMVRHIFIRRRRGASAAERSLIVWTSVSSSARTWVGAPFSQS